MTKSNEKTKKDQYDFLKYDSLERFNSYYYQIKSILELNPKTVLEIGIGNKLVSNHLKTNGVEVKTMDIDSKRKPDVVGDIRDIPIEDDLFDVVAAFEILEHIPFDQVDKAVKELKRVSKRFIVISVPSTSLNIFAYYRLFPGMKPKHFMLKFCDAFFLKHKFSGVLGSHYWVLGKKGSTRKIVKKIFKRNNLKIIKEFHPEINTGHYFFVLEKKE